jgi:hypothetical protein
MPHKREKYAPKHRQATPHLADAPKKALRTSVMFSSVAVAATGGIVASGVVSTPPAISTAASDLEDVVPTPSDQDTGQDTEERTAPVTRSDSRRGADPDKEAALSEKDGPAVTRTESLDDDDPRDIARALLPDYGWSHEYDCLDALYVSESNWRIDADNPTSSAYGIPQALTETHDMPPGYFTSAEVQIRWGLNYIQDSYGSPCSAWEFKQSNNWY